MCGIHVTHSNLIHITELHPSDVKVTEKLSHRGPARLGPLTFSVVGLYFLVGVGWGDGGGDEGLRIKKRRHKDEIKLDK